MFENLLPWGGANSTHKEDPFDWLKARWSDASSTWFSSSWWTNGASDGAVRVDDEPGERSNARFLLVGALLAGGLAVLLVKGK